MVDAEKGPSRAEVEAIIGDFFRTRFPSVDVELTATTDLRQHFITNSLNLVRVVVFLAERFGVEMVPGRDDLDIFASIDSLADFVLRSR